MAPRNRHAAQGGTPPATHSAIMTSKEFKQIVFFHLAKMLHQLTKNILRAQPYRCLHKRVT